MQTQEVKEWLKVHYQFDEMLEMQHPGQAASVAIQEVTKMIEIENNVERLTLMYSRLQDLREFLFDQILGDEKARADAREEAAWAKRESMYDDDDMQDLREESSNE